MKKMTHSQCHGIIFADWEACRVFFEKYGGHRSQVVLVKREVPWQISSLWQSFITLSKKSIKVRTLFWKKKKIVRKIINRNHNKIKDQDNHVVPSKRCSFCAFCDVFFMTVFSRWHSEDNLLVWWLTGNLNASKQMPVGKKSSLPYCTP